MTIPAWPPTRYTPPLPSSGGGVVSLFDKYANAFDIAWPQAFGYTLEDWQVELLRAITELKPDGRLRFRQVLVSLGRQNGKTEIAAALGLLFMLWKAAPLVVGIASSADQARLVYDRAMAVIGRNPALKKRFDRLTDTRGIGTVTGGKWTLKASKSAALQGLPIDLAVVDEVHLVKAPLWADLLNGTGDRPNCMVCGITTAGDDSSELLKRLYDVEADSFGTFIWEAPEARVPEDDATLGEYLLAANPALACGRRDLETAIADCRTMPDRDVIRYRLNRFIAGTVDAFLPLDKWAPLAGTVEHTTPVVFAVDRSPDWSAATVTASSKADDGSVVTEVVASLVKPSLSDLVRECERLAKFGPRAFVVDGYSLKALANELKLRGLPVVVSSLAEMTGASARLYALVASKKLKHAGDPLLTRQLPMTRRKNVGEQFRISRADSASEIDAVISTALGVYFAETLPEQTIQLF
ncbi:Phage terminase-like protein, large subunit, contains N-terminal HTH domain [Micrococcales bacterium KH10]|nr:Phage terminase-like protein, large subunit, contains N-terminal HTH domain [Micrococcales bacterium KH10]